MVNSWRSFILIFLFLILWVTNATAVSVQAVADRDQVAVGESLQFQLRVDGSPDGDPDVTVLEQSWEILSRSQSSQVQIINGNLNRSVVYTLTLMPRAQGTVIIPAVCFAKDCSLPLPITVTDAEMQTGSSDDVLLLETEVSSQEIVTQGQLIFKVRLLRRVDLFEGQLNEPNPTGVSAVVKKLGDDRSYEIRRNGLLYQVIERSYAIFPQGSGQMLIPALQFDGRIPAARSRFDPFAQQGRRVRRTSQPLHVEVTPLPTDLGSRLWLPATALELQDDWQQHPPKFVVGEPVTRTLRLSAGGVLAAQLPELIPGVPDGFKTYPDQPKRNDQLNNSGITGTIEQKVAIIPTQAGSFTLPAIDLDWWDISTGKWKLVHLAALELEVAPAPGVAQSHPAPRPPVSEVKPLRTDAESPTPLMLPATGSKTWSNFWFWLSLALALGWTVTLILMWRRHRKPQEPPVVTTHEPSEKIARKEVLQAARSHDPRATRKALLAWSLSLWPEKSSGAYERLSHNSGQELRAEFAALDSCLYGRSASFWNGDQLAELVKKWQLPAPIKKNSELPDLYPKDRGS